MLSITLLWVLVITLFCKIISKKEKERQGFKDAVKQTKILNDGTLSSIQKWNSLLVVQQVQSCLCKGKRGKDQPGHHWSQWWARDSPLRVLSLPPRTRIQLGARLWYRTSDLLLGQELWAHHILSRSQELKPQFHFFTDSFFPLPPTYQKQNMRLITLLQDLQDFLLTKYIVGVMHRRNIWKSRNDYYKLYYKR